MLSIFYNINPPPHMLLPLALRIYFWKYFKNKNKITFIFTITCILIALTRSAFSLKYHFPSAWRSSLTFFVLQSSGDRFSQFLSENDLSHTFLRIFLGIRNSRFTFYFKYFKDSLLSSGLHCLWYSVQSFLHSFPVY